MNEAGELERVHQEDFCQALGINEKYQEKSGPSFSQCLQLMQNISAKPLTDTENLLKWHIFNLLCGNSDAHAKNLAILYLKDGIRLAPFYDLVCTRAIERIDSKLAMAIGGEYNPDLISKLQLEKLAKECGIRSRYLFTLVEELSTNLQDLVKPQNEWFLEYLNSYPQLQRVQKVIAKQCKRLLKSIHL